jgi:hypothetical protein
VKSFVHQRDVQHAYRIRPHLRIDRAHQLVRRPVLAQVHVRDLAKCMHACIRAACTEHGHVRFAKPCNGIFNAGLDRGLAVLALPAAERCPVILDGQLVARHVGTLFQTRAGFRPQAIEERCQIHRTLAFALQAQRPDGACATGNGEPVIQHFAGLA